MRNPGAFWSGWWRLLPLRFGAEAREEKEQKTRNRSGSLICQSCKYYRQLLRSAGCRIAL